MQWRIDGADRRTGREVSVVVEADSEAQAQERARRRGLLITTIEPVDAEPQEPADAVDWAQHAEPTPEVATEVATTPATPLSYRTPATRAVPQYRSLKLAGAVLRGVAWVLAALAALMLVGGIVAGGLAAQQPGFTGQPVGAGLAGFLMMLLPAIGTLVSALMCHAVGSLCEAIRDIARNSFRA